MNFPKRLHGAQQGEAVRVNRQKEEVRLYQSLLPMQIIKPED